MRWPLDIYRSINPFIEASFKTLKYAPVFPDRFASLAQARAFMTARAVARVAWRLARTR
nr:hypothetical protein [Salinispora pacifica]